MFNSNNRLIETLVLLVCGIVLAILIKEYVDCEGTLYRTLFWVECR